MTTPKLKPFFTFYGGKWRAAPHYPKPDYDTIIEPFCGSAGYSMRYPDRKIILVEKDPVIAVTWKYLMRVTPEEILGLPDIQMDQTVDDLGVCEESRYLIGWWLNGGSAQPKKRPGSWMRSMEENGGGGWTTGGGHLSWSERVRQRIASQVEHIRHWTLIEGTYDDAPDIEATWFIDPPYIEAGKHYRHGASGIDYTHLGQWCREREGQVMVCENVGADWLPFEHFRNIKGSEAKHGGKVSREAIWQNHTNLFTRDNPLIQQDFERIDKQENIRLELLEDILKELLEDRLLVDTDFPSDQDILKTLLAYKQHIRPEAWMRS